MSRSDTAFPSAEEGLSLHLRLCEQDAMAPADVCRAYLVPLTAWLERTCRPVDFHHRETAVHDTLIQYVQQPAIYDPRRSDLAAFLRMAARRDLWNLLRAEGRHHRDRLPCPGVEDEPLSGNFSTEEDPQLQLQRAEEQECLQNVLHAVQAACTEEERRVLDLLLDGERTTDVYAAALGLSHLPRGEQEREVKRMKDRLKKRLEREGAKHG